MGVNKAENSINDALVNKVNQLERDFNDFRNFPQKIGLGSLDLARFTDSFIWSGVSIPAGAIRNFYVDLAMLTYDGYPSFNAANLINPLLDIRVDADAATSSLPLGSSLTAGQQNAQASVWSDLANSMPFASTSPGFRRVWIQIRNNDTAAHIFYLRMNVLMMRPILKKL